MSAVLDAALGYLHAGVSVIPISLDGIKTPAFSFLPLVWDETEGKKKHKWEPYQENPADDVTARAWWTGKTPPGIAAVCGAVSNGLEVIDFDINAAVLFPAWWDLVEAECPGLPSRLCIHQTPRQPEAYHVWFRCLDVETPGNLKLACLSKEEEADGKKRTLIETRGEGGYALLPGSPAECHETGGLYRHLSGPTLLDMLPISMDERDALLRAARSFDRNTEEDSRPKNSANCDLRPGDRFDREGWSWEELLGPQGWTVWQKSGDVTYWTRPGKDRGCSASTGYCKRAKDGAELFRVFSSNAAPFDVDKAYSKFRVFALTQTGGDWGEAALQVVRLGFVGTSRNGKVPHKPAGTGPSTKQPAAIPWKVILDEDVIAEGDPNAILEGISEEEGPQVQVYEMHTMGSLLKKVFPPPVWIVPGVMSEGLNLLAGAPKQGKSMLALHLALTVAGGGMALRNISVQPADVLYLSLEDKQRRVQYRAVKMMNAIDPSYHDSIRKRLTIATEWPTQDRGGLRMIELWRKRVEKAGLVIIDVWARFAPKHDGQQSSYSQDSQDWGKLKQFADRYSLAALAVHHTRKPGVGKEDSDYVMEVSGTSGITGVADGIMVLLRARQDVQARFHIVGRDVEEKELVLEFNPETLTWHSLGSAAEHLKGEVQQAIIRFLRNRGDAGAGAPEIAEGVHQKQDSVRKALNRMLVERIVTKKGNIWRYPFEDEPDVISPPPEPDELSL